MKKLDSLYIDKALSYEDYRELIQRLLQKNKTTGSNSSEFMVHYTRLNEKRMQRLDKTIEIIPELKELMGKIDHKYYWMILTEGWCGDAAQCIPVIEKAAALNENVLTGYLLRDDNPELMEQYLTRGGKAIPKLICYDGESHKPLFHWGPRPEPAQELYWELHDQGQSHEVSAEKLQRWYNEDKSQTQQAELVALIKEQIKKLSS